MSIESCKPFNVSNSFHSLNIVSYNVDGLFSKLSDVDFLSFIDNFDCVCLLETFMIDNIIPKNIFRQFLPAFFFPAIPSSGQGRASGGIVVLVKTKFKNIVSRIEIDFHSSIVLLFKNVLCGPKKDLVLISSYIHPYGSTFYNNCNENNGIHLFENSFFKLYKRYLNSEFLLTGDFNSRIGNTQPCEELIISDKYIENINTLSFFDSNCYEDFTRLSEDNTTNIFGKSFIELIASFNLIVLNGLLQKENDMCFTYLSPTGNSVIDYFLVSDTLLTCTNKMSVLSRTESFHLPISLTLNLDTNDIQCVQNNSNEQMMKNEEYNFIKWDNEKLNQFMFQCSVNNFELYLQYLENDLENNVDACIKKFCQFFLNASFMMETTCKKIKNLSHIKYNSNTYFDKECYEQKLALRKCFRKYRRNKNNENKSAYTECRKKYKSFVRNKKNIFNNLKIQSILKNFKNSKLFWKDIQSISVNTNTYHNIETKDFFSYFKSIFQKDATPPPICSEPNQTPYYTFDDQNESFLALNSDITREDVEYSLSVIKSNKSPGTDFILNEMLKSTSLEITPFLVSLFNYIFKNKIFPTEWKKSIIVPIHKKGDVSICSNFRPISLTSLLSKTYTNILNKRLTNFVEANNILPAEQGGFREKYSTVDHIFTLYSMIFKQFSKDQKLYVAFVDYSKCFDTVNKHALFNVLEKNGINGPILESIKSIYENVFACIKNYDEFSEFFECPIGLKQGCILSPRLFTIFISEVSRIINSKCSSGFQFLANLAIIHHLFWADDIILVSDTPQGLQQKLNILEEQSTRLGVKVNLEKTKIIVFRKGGFLSKFEKWFYGGHPVEVVNKYVYLGFEFTTKMSITSSLSSFIIKAKHALNALFRSLSTIECHENKIFFKLFDSKVLPILSYSSEFWGVFNIEDVEKVHTFAIKRFLNVSNHSSNSIVYAETGRVPLYINHLISSIKYWFKLLKRPDTHLSKQAYLMLLDKCNKGYDNWATKIKKVLCENGFGIVWISENVENEGFVLSEIKRKLTDIFLQSWNSKMLEKENLQIYYSFKSFVTPEFYLSSHHIDYKSRTCLTQFRCGVSKINTHRYRYYDNQSLKHCPFCPHQLETELHSIFFCKAYDDIRTKFLPKQFIENPNTHTFNILISNYSYQIILSKYLLAMFAKRKKTLNV